MTERERAEKMTQQVETLVHVLDEILACETKYDERGHAYLKIPARSLNDLGAAIAFYRKQSADLLSSLPPVRAEGETKYPTACSRYERCDCGSTILGEHCEICLCPESDHIPAPVRAEAPTTARECSCKGFCKGRDGLSSNYRCALDGKPGKVAALPPVRAEGETATPAERHHINGLFSDLGVKDGATLQDVQRKLGVNTPNAMRLFSLHAAIRSIIGRNPAPVRAEEPTDKSVKLDVIARSYGWTMDYKGEIHGLTAGDQGFEPTGIVLRLSDVPNFHDRSDMEKWGDDLVRNGVITRDEVDSVLAALPPVQEPPKPDAVDRECPLDCHCRVAPSQGVRLDDLKALRNAVDYACSIHGGWDKEHERYLDSLIESLHEVVDDVSDNEHAAAALRQGTEAVLTLRRTRDDARKAIIELSKLSAALEGAATKGGQA